MLIFNIILSAMVWFLLPVGCLLCAVCLVANAYHRIYFGVAFFSLLNVAMWVSSWKVAVAMVANGGLLLCI